MVLPIDPYTRAAIQQDLELGFNNDAIMLGGYDFGLRILQRMRKSWRQYREVFQALNYVPEEELLVYLE
jgi:hypothetical protein